MCSVGGIVVSIAAFQAVDPGSIPGQRKHQFFTQVYKMLASAFWRVLASLLLCRFSPMQLLNLLLRAFVYLAVAWPSGLRRWIKAPVSSEAWVQIPPLPL